MKWKLMLILFLLGSNLLAQKKTNVAPTPPMGWNSWNYFACDVNEDMIKEMADAMVESGMADAGYEYINIDDCWQIDRDENGKIVADPDRFPNGIKALADYVHSKGLKFGLYSDAGRLTCEERPGGLGYEKIDAETYQEWGVDYLKYDWCHHGLHKAKKLYPVMAAELAKLDRPIVFSICNWGWGKPWKWGGEIGHLWRTTPDIKACFDCGGFFRLSVLKILDKQVGLEKYAGPDAWNDPDMLEVGNGDLTDDENKAHFSLWCILAAPLIAGNDLRNMPKDVIEVLTNKEAIAIDQDPLGKQGYKYKDKKDFEVWIKPLENDEWAVCLLNRSEEKMDINFNWQKELNLKKEYTVRDLWKHQDIGKSSESYQYELPSHAVLFVRLQNP